MGHIVEFPSNGSTGRGYFAPVAGGGPGVLVVQEWWGLVPHIEAVCDRFAAAGFSALAPDLYGGVTTTEPDEAGKLMMALNLDQAARDFSSGIDFLLGSDTVTSAGVGVIGFCMGGGLALTVACQRPDVVGRAPFYGIFPWPHSEPDWTKLAAPVRGHFAANDGMFGPAAVADLQGRLDELGKDVQLQVHPDVDHAFFNDSRPEVYAPVEAEAAWSQTLDFFRATIN